MSFLLALAILITHSYTYCGFQGDRPPKHSFLHPECSIRPQNREKGHLISKRHHHCMKKPYAHLDSLPPQKKTRNRLIWRIASNMCPTSTSAASEQQPRRGEAPFGPPAGSTPVDGDRYWVPGQLIFMVLCNVGYRQFTADSRSSMCSLFIVV